MNLHHTFTDTENGNSAGYKQYRNGTHRTIEPADTVAKLRKLMPKLAITRVANVTGLDRINIPVIMVC